MKYFILSISIIFLMTACSSNQLSHNNENIKNVQNIEKKQNKKEVSNEIKLYWDSIPEEGILTGTFQGFIDQNFFEIQDDKGEYHSINTMNMGGIDAIYQKLNEGDKVKIEYKITT